MTNFEWLVKKGRLEGFLQDIAEKGTGLENVVVYDKFAEEWGLPFFKFYVAKPIYSSITEWLEEEHKEPKAKEYVLLEDVESLLKELQAEGSIDEFLYIEPTLRENLKVREIDE